MVCFLPSRRHMATVMMMSVKKSPAASNVLKMSIPDSLTLILE